MNGINFMNILLVEDNMADVRLTKEALKESKVKINLQVAMDGEEAINLLNKSLVDKKIIRPELILLDLNLPKKDGRQVLAEIKNNDKLKSIPVVVLTTSRSEEDVVKAYGLHANAYVTKPIDMDQFIKIVQSIEDFWFTIVRLPKD
jgi:chemotaxis family two-component system response regulator Rcp1